MTLETSLTSCVQRIASEFQTTYSLTGSLSNLSTTTKSNLVAAINEVVTQIGTVQSNLSSDLTNRLATLKNDILGGASAAYDTLKEIQTFLEQNDSQVNALLSAIGNRVRFDMAQSLTDTQKQTARSNIGAVSMADVGNYDIDLVSVFNAALAA